MGKEVLITGGAGFIGSHLCDHLIDKGYQVTILDDLNEQVHGKGKKPPSYLNPSARLIVGDVRDSETVQDAVRNADIVFHFAARVGVGQSMYEIAGYTDVNNFGTAVLLEAIIKNPARLIVASSMSIYGEGFYRDADGRRVPGFERSLTDLKRGFWELRDSRGEQMQPLPTGEDKIPWLNSVYALSKYDQERLCLMTGRAYGFPVTALRFFNVYGTRQSLSNPYTGVLAIFASRLLNGKPPLVYEDGNQKRDFINVKDITRACILACEKKQAEGEVFNIGSGNAYTISEIAERLSKVMGLEHLGPVITSNYRAGDIRHCYADITRAGTMLGFVPSVDLNAGLSELSSWLSVQEAEDKFEKAGRELERRGLLI